MSLGRISLLPGGRGRPRIPRPCRKEPPPLAYASSTNSLPSTTRRRRAHPFGGDRLLPPNIDAARTRPAQAPREGLRPRPPDRRQGGVERACGISVRGVVDLRGGGLPAARLGLRRPCRPADDLGGAR